jgi:hypothetical protein
MPAGDDGLEMGREPLELPIRPPAKRRRRHGYLPLMENSSCNMSLAVEMICEEA